MKDTEKRGLRSSSSSSSSTTSTNDMSQSISLFKKYLLKKSQNNIIMGATNTQESEIIIKNSPNSDHASSSPSPPKHTITITSSLDRPPSLLEKALLPQMRSDGVLPSLTSAERCSTGQLTIFYDGAINVYENIPRDKAQAIMLLAGESSSSNTRAESPEMEEALKIHQVNVTPRSKLKTGIPLARRHSLQSFLQKRRDRKLVRNKSAYYASAIPSSRNKGEVTTVNNNINDREGINQIHGVSLSPFPSRLGFCVPISVDKAC